MMMMIGIMPALQFQLVEPLLYLDINNRHRQSCSKRLSPYKNYEISLTDLNACTVSARCPHSCFVHFFSFAFLLFGLPNLGHFMAKDRPLRHLISNVFGFPCVLIKIELQNKGTKAVFYFSFVISALRNVDFQWHCDCHV